MNMNEHTDFKSQDTSELPLVIIFTDGGASPNPGLGGWAAILHSPKHNFTREIYGAEANTTNNRMELTAAIKALEALKFPCHVKLTTDSQYLRNAFVKGWLENWLTGSKWRNGRVLNQDLWECLLALSDIHEIEWEWVRGHGDNYFNNRCDELVHKARDEFRFN